MEDVDTTTSSSTGIDDALLFVSETPFGVSLVGCWELALILNDVGGVGDVGDADGTLLLIWLVWFEDCFAGDSDEFVLPYKDVVGLPEALEFNGDADGTSGIDGVGDAGDVGDAGGTLLLIWLVWFEDCVAGDSDEFVLPCKDIVGLPELLKFNGDAGGILLLIWLAWFESCGVDCVLLGFCGFGFCSPFYQWYIYFF